MTDDEMTVGVYLTYAELLLLRQGLKELDPGKQTAVNPALDAKIYRGQLALEGAL